ncbi:hypothetical protein MYX07_02535 [Patescibacteria group bacterium AH-259-L07]|nr:hypothetical protein [Patescibacteria group bacterium AH-259-L07]
MNPHIHDEAARLKRLFNFCKNYAKNPDDKERILQSFFSIELGRYYDCLSDGLPIMTGHFIYRLSDLVPIEQRRTMAIYPNEESGSVIPDHTDPDPMPWDSLEDWRQTWKKDYSPIPKLLKEIPATPASSLSDTSQTR